MKTSPVEAPKRCGVSPRRASFLSMYSSKAGSSLDLGDEQQVQDPAVVEVEVIDLLR